MKSLAPSIYMDYRRYRATDESWFETVFLCQGFWASTGHRIARYLRDRIQNRLLRKIVNVLAAFPLKALEIVTSISIPSSCDVGKGLYIGHFGPTIVNGKARIGDFCNLSQGVTIGQGGRGEKMGAPVIGNRVYIGAHAILIGKITIGDDAAIGAGAVVTKSVPARGVAVGNPARIISHNGSFDFVRYDGMDLDPARSLSLEMLRHESAIEPLNPPSP